MDIEVGDICEWCACEDQAVAIHVRLRMRVCEYTARSTVKLVKPPKKRPPREGYIYFVQAGRSGPVKIGWSTAPHGRLEFFQTGHYEKLRIVRLIEGTITDERRLHKRFAAYHILNEWFEPRVLRYVDAELSVVSDKDAR